MDLISEKPVFRSRLIFFWSLILILLHIALTLFSLNQSYISGDIVYENATIVMDIVTWLTALLLLYIRFAVPVSVYHSYSGKNALPYTVVSVVSILLSQISRLIIYGYTYSDFASDSAPYLFNALTGFAIDLAVLLIIFVISRGSEERKRSIVRLALITCILSAAITLTDQIVYLIQFFVEINSVYGSMALTSEEARDIIIDCVRPFLNGGIGFVIILVTNRILKKIK